ncbi:hypothetical protein LJR230_002124 [Trinickia sp. LjRoot230]|uniref:hypothetical protein n=1 Tax=Trinickia sp. LjRoot230 TaxID=3342288 RepID=UPI003ECE3DF0
MAPPDSIAPGQGAAAILVEALASECNGNLRGAALVLRAMFQPPPTDRIAATAFKVKCRLAHTEIGRNMLGVPPAAATSDPRQREAHVVAYMAAGELIAALPQNTRAPTSRTTALALAQTMVGPDDAGMAAYALVCAHKILDSQNVSAEEANAYLLYRSGVTSAATASAIRTRTNRCLPANTDDEIEVLSFKERMKSDGGEGAVLTKGTVEQWEMMRSISAALPALSRNLSDLRNRFREPERLAKNPKAVEVAVRIATLIAAQKKIGQWTEGGMDFKLDEANSIAEDAAKLLGMKRRFLFSAGTRLKLDNPGWAATTADLTAKSLRVWVNDASEPMRDNSVGELEKGMIDAREALSNRLDLLRIHLPPRTFEHIAQSQDAVEAAIMCAKLSVELDMIESATNKGKRSELLQFVPGGLTGSKANRIARLAAGLLGMRRPGAKQEIMQNSAWLPITSQDLTIDAAGLQSDQSEVDVSVTYGSADDWRRWAAETPLDLTAIARTHRTSRFLARLRKLEPPDEPLSHDVRTIEDSPIDPYLPKPSLLPEDTAASLEDLTRMLSSIEPGGQLLVSAHAINGPDGTAAINSPAVPVLGVSATILPTYTNVRDREMMILLEVDDGAKGAAVKIRLGTADGSIKGKGIGAAISAQPLAGPWVARGAAEFHLRKIARTFEGVEITIDCGDVEQSKAKAIELLGRIQRSGMADQWAAIPQAYYADPSVTVRDVHREENGKIRPLVLTATAGIATVFQHLPTGYNAWNGPLTRQAVFEFLNSVGSQENIGGQTTVSQRRAEASGTNKLGLLGWLPGIPGSWFGVGTFLDSVGMASTGIPGSASSAPRLPVTTLVHLGGPDDADNAFYRTHVFDLKGFNAWQKEALPADQRISLDELDSNRPSAENAAASGQREVRVETPLTPEAAAEVRTIQQAIQTLTATRRAGQSNGDIETRIGEYQAALFEVLNYAGSWDRGKTVVYVQDSALAERVTTPPVPVIPYFQRRHADRVEATQRTAVARGGRDSLN